MKHSDFSIGQTFRCGDRLWRCTDVGSRVVVAVRADYVRISSQDGDTVHTITRRVGPADLQGPPYGLAETVFDEYDLPACEPVNPAQAGSIGDADIDD